MNSKNNIVIGVVVVVLIGALGFLFLQKTNDSVVVVNETPESTDMMPVEPDGGIGDGAQPLPIEQAEMRGPESVIGASVAGTEIMAYHFGLGEKELLFVGGTHGSYSKNTAELANQMVSYFEENPSEVPQDVTITIIPELNPDGLAMSGDAGRFNTNNVDINRNFACDWSATSMWRSQEVSGGSKAFSEPEAEALRTYVENHNITAAVVWFAAEGKVYPSACEGAPSQASIELAATFATAAGYPAEAEFDAYKINGDMVNWMASEGIPAISVLLSDYTSTEWTKNKTGVEAILSTYTQ